MYQTFLQAYALAKKDDCSDKFVVDDRKYSYPYIDQLSDYYACAIQHHFKGHCQGRRVGTLVPNGIDLLALVLALFKTRCVWVPLDPSLSSDVLSKLIDISEVRLILGEKSDFPIQISQHYYSISSFKSSFDPSKVMKYEIQKNQETDLAYIIHTSGTTGLPKGVEVSHFALMNYLGWAKREYFSIDPQRIAVFSPPWVDLSLTALLLPLVSSLKAKIFKKANVRVWTNEIVTDEAIDFIKCTPSHLELVKDIDSSTKHLKQLVIGGEELKPTLINWLAGVNSDLVVYNEYGPTECTVGCVFSKVSESTQNDMVAIGIPIQGVQVSIINQEQHPEGVSGELRIFGNCLANGYVGKAQQGGFGIDPKFGPYYETGDRVLKRDGSDELFFLGRIDRQVKIQGHRIELRGIECHFDHLSFVSSCHVLYLEGQGLILFIKGELYELEEKQLFDHSQTLPQVAQPSEFRKVEKIYLRENGKIDDERLHSHSTVIHPNPSKKSFSDLSDIWQLILGVEVVKKEDDFFELGGSSIHIPMVKALILEHYNVEITLRELLEKTVFSELLELIVNTSALVKEDERKSELDIYAGSDNSIRLWKAWRINQEDSEHNCTVLFSLPMYVVKKDIRKTLIALLKKIRILRRNISYANGKFIETTNLNDPIVEEVNEDLFNHYEKHQVPFDILNELCFRCFFNQKEGFIQFMFDTHHSNADGYSNKLIVQTFIRLLQGKREEQQVLSAPLFKSIASLKSVEKDFWITGVKVWQHYPHFPRYSIKSQYSRKKDHLTLKFTQEEQEQIIENAMCFGTGPSQFIFSSFALALSSFFKLDQFLIAVFHLGRVAVEDFSKVGAFAHPLPVAIECHRQLKIIESMKRACRSFLNTMENQNIRLDEIIQLDNEFGTGDLLGKIKVGFLYQSAPLFKLGEKALQRYDLPFSRVESFPISLEVKEGDTFSMNLAFDVDFSRDNAVNLSESLRYILLNYAVLENKVLKNQNYHKTTVPSYPMSSSKINSSIIELYQSLAFESPDLLAISDATRSLSYKELWEWSAVIGSLLESHQLKEEVVCVHMSNSVELLVAIVGIWKVGAIYMPLDIGLPQERKEYILANSGAKVVIGTARIGSLPFIEFLRKTTQSAASENSPNYSKMSSTAYIIYTSGSTGLPKGVPVAHNSLMCALTEFQRKINLTDRDRLYHRTSPGFDVSLLELLLPVCSGASVYVGKNTNEVSQIVRDISESESTMFSQTPSMFLHISSYLERMNYQLKHLKKVVLAGETLSLQLLKRAKKQLDSEVDLFNFYGPTEATIACTIFSCSEQLEEWQEVPIGRPIDHVNLAILSKNGELLPQGSMGELCISGETITMGYWKNEELNKERFLDINGQKYYKTGDLAQKCEMGYYWFRGRSDDQIKRNGYRIELGEIRAQIECLSGVDEAVVVNMKNQIVAFYRSKSKVPESELSNQLGKMLPYYMLPNRIVFWESDFPKNQNGKLDKSSFVQKMIEFDDDTAEVPSILGRCILEAASLALDKNNVSWKSDFFTEGGSSLSSIVFAYELSRYLGVDVKIETIYKERTFQNIASFIENRPRLIEHDVSYFNFGSSVKVWFAFPPAFGSGLLFEKLETHLTDIRICSFSFDDRANLLQRYVLKINQLQSKGKITLIGYSGGGNIAFEVAKLLESQGREVSKIIMLDSWRKQRPLSTMSGDLLESRSAVTEYLKDEFVEHEAVFKHQEHLLMRYYHFLNIELEDSSGIVNANIFNLICEGKKFLKMVDDQRRLLLKDWKGATSGFYTEMSVPFGHFDFLEKGLSQTVQLIKQLQETEET